MDTWTGLGLPWHTAVWRYHCERSSVPKEVGWRWHCHSGFPFVGRFFSPGSNIGTTLVLGTTFMAPRLVSLSISL